MSPFKSEIYALCTTIAEVDFPGWKFASKQFKNDLLPQTTLVIDPGFVFQRTGDSAWVSPNILVYNKKISRLYKYIFGKGKSVPASFVNTQQITHLFRLTPEKLRPTYYIEQDKEKYLAQVKAEGSFKEETLKRFEEKSVDFSEARPVLTATLKDVMHFIDEYYDLGSEQALLSALPPRYTTRHERTPYSQTEQWPGVMLCVVRILLGDFDYVEHYRSDDFKTVYPKQVANLDKIMAALPELKRRHAETGSVV